jgi:uncharacterized protein YbcI
MPNLEEAPERREGSINASIANAVVRLVHEYTGRGADKARATISGDLVTVLMRDTLTRAERSLVRDGKGETVRTIRHEFQQTMREDLIAAVEMLTERKVVAFMSDNHVDPDVSVEAFLLEPALAGARTSEEV